MKMELTDEDAMEVVAEQAQSSAMRNQVATHFVERTILYPVALEYKPGVKTKEIRSFVRQYEYCSPAQWQEALELEKKYPKLNAAHRKALESEGKPVNVKEPGNPMNTTIINI
jgi:hypothetical protein